MLFEENLLREEKSLEETITSASKYRDLPGIVLVASGENYYYREAFGNRSVDKTSDEQLRTHAPFALASCTKLMTSVAALQCVECGLFELDADITGVLPELKNKTILLGFDRKTGKPQLRRSANTLTLRHLLTHTSGLSSPSFSPLLRRYLAISSRGYHPIPLILEGRITQVCSYPLLHEPGTSFSYGCSLDWAGLAIARATNMSLEAYMLQNVWNPLSMTSATFHLGSRPDLESALPDFTHRLGLIHPQYQTLMSDRGILVSSAEMEETEAFPCPSIDTERSSLSSCSEDTEGAEDEFGGGGAYCSAEDFGKLLHSLACPSSRPQILKSTTIEAIFSPQLGLAAHTALQKTMTIPEMGRVIAGLSQDSLRIDNREMKVDWGLGGLLTMEDMHGEMGGRRRGKGSMSGAGESNISWFCDRLNGVSGVYACQLLPAGDRTSVGMMGVFEEAMYRRIDEEECRRLQNDEMTRMAEKGKGMEREREGI